MLCEDLHEHDVSVTALLPGATDSDFHRGMGANTPIGRLPKFPKQEVARLGYDGLMAGDDMVVGGDDVREVIERNRITPEPVKAAAHARLVRPDGVSIAEHRHFGRQAPKIRDKRLQALQKAQGTADRSRGSRPMLAPALRPR
jgi:hypothetical protein